MQNQQPKQHSDNSPSSLRRRELCPASYRLEKGLPDTESDDSKRGTRLHELVEAMLKCDGEGASAALMSDFEDVTDYDWLLATWCADQVRKLTWDKATLLTEHRLDLTHVEPTIESGTADVLLVEPFVKAIVFDFKFGFKAVPPAADNLQLACYAAGTMAEFDVSDVQVCVLQPALHVIDLAPFKQETLDRAIAAARTSSTSQAAPNPGDEQCRYCKAAGQCPAAFAIVSSPDIQPAVDKASVALMPIQKISEFLAAWEDKDVKGIIGAMKQRLMEACLTGYEDERWKIGKGRPSRKFIDGVEPKLKELCEKHGKDAAALYTTPELKTVSQVETVIGKAKAVKADFTPLVINLDGKPKLERKAPEQLFDDRDYPGKPRVLPGLPEYTGD